VTIVVGGPGALAGEHVEDDVGQADAVGGPRSAGRLYRRQSVQNRPA
jgi:hypothetical protein